MAHSIDTTLTYQLKAGILNTPSAWVPLLAQIGIPHEQANLQAPDLVQRYSVLIVNGKPDRDTLKILHSYHDRGGAILDTGPYLHYRDGNVFVDKHISQIIPEAQKRFHHVGRIDLHQTASVYQEAEFLDHTVHLPQNQDRIGYLGWNLDQALTDERYVRKSFYTKDGLAPNEIVSKVSLSPIRRTVTEILKDLHHSRGLPFVKLWPFPKKKKQFFGFRVDTDYGNRQTLSAIYDLADQYNLSMTWFLHVEAHRDWLNFFHSFNANQEIAVHGYKHQTYRGYDRNFQNIEEAIYALKENQFQYEGYCAPYGLWNRKLQQVIEDLHLNYSSEFCFDYDDYPIFPYDGKRKSKALQIPVHPVGIGRLQHSGATNRQMLSYFKRIIKQQWSRHEPAILYHHPNQSANNIFSRLFEYLSHGDTYNQTMGEYARWWKKREKLQYKATFHNGIIQLESHSPSTAVYPVLFDKSNRYSILDFGSEYRVDNLQYSTFDPATPIAVKRVIKESYYNPRLLKTSILDYMHRLGS